MEVLRLILSPDVFCSGFASKSQIARWIQSAGQSPWPGIFIIMYSPRKTNLPFACDDGDCARAARGTRSDDRKLFRSVQSKHELPDGDAFELPNDSDVLLTSAEFISLERLCCPFFGFELQVEREGGSVWLSLRGRDGVKQFIMAEIGEYLPASTNDEHR